MELHRPDATIWWDEVGEGTAVLLLNGLGSPSGTWFRLARQLATHHRVLTLDNRGTGRTGVPPGAYSVETLAEDAAAVIAAAGGTPVHVVGLSMGGLIAQQLTLSRPDLVRSLVLASTHAGVPHAAAPGPEGLPDPAVPAAMAQAAMLEPDSRMSVLAPYMYAAATPSALIDEDEAVRATAPTAAEGFFRQLTGVSTWERLGELATIGAPTLVLHGLDDQIVPVAHGRFLAEQIVDATLVTVADAGHQVFTDAETTAAAHLLDFFARCDATHLVEESA
jgi:3-oxoadipate enol-lactonase